MKKSNQVRRKFLGQGFNLFLLALASPLRAVAQTTSLGFWKNHVEPIAFDPPSALGSADLNLNQASFTFVNMPLGDDHRARRVFAFFAWRDDATISDPVGAVIHGVTANLVARNGYETASIAIYEALVPAGATGDITINFGEAIRYGCSCTTMRFLNLKTIPSSATSKEISKGTGGSNPIIPANLTAIPANSYVIALGILQNTTSNLSWSTLPEVMERNGANGFRYSIAVQFYATAQASLGQSFYGASGTTQSCCWNYIT